MILVDTGPLIAALDPADDSHEACVRVLKQLEEPLLTTVPVLTEAFHLLGPGGRGASNLMDFVSEGAVSVWFLSANALERTFELMTQYRDHPMDLADASLVVTAEFEGSRKVFTLDRNDFDSYRIRRGHRLVTFEVIGPRR